MKKLFLAIVLLALVTVNAQEKSESKLTKNGVYIESILGVASTDFNSTHAGLGLKLGNVWYFGNSDFWKPGFKTVWFRGTGYFGDSVILQGSVLNVGFANVIQFKENLGIEANLNFGYNVIFQSEIFEENNTLSEDFFGGGIMINPELKFRYNILSVGLDFVFSRVNDFDGYNDDYIQSNNGIISLGDIDTNFTAINLSFGVKF